LIGFSFAGEHIELCDQDRDALRLVATFAVGRALQLRSSNRFAAQATITSRERQALQLAADGLRDQEIALRMGISRHGAEKHLRSAREKLQARNTIKAIAISMRLGIIR
jgi:LuxR family quorum sensing-dependent transcriptional regulator